MVQEYKINTINELDEFNFHQTISETVGIALVFFTGPHCASCHHLKGLLKENFDAFTVQFSLFTIFEIKADKATALVNEFSVFHLPSMFLYRDGDYHCELQFEASPNKIIKAVELGLKKQAEDEP